MKQSDFTAHPGGFLMGVLMSYYDRTGATCVLSVLGEDYRIFLDVPETEDPILKECSGYCDKTSRRIAVCAKESDANLDDDTRYRKRVLRHEIIHAFLFESGLGADAPWQVSGQEHPEMVVDWMARQFPKLLKAFQTVGAL